MATIRKEKEKESLHVRIDLFAALVALLGSHALGREDVPFVRLGVLVAVDFLETFVELDVNRVAIVRPTAKLHRTILLIVRKLLNAYLTCGFEDAWRTPFDRSVAVYDGQHVALLFETRVGIVVQLDVRRPNLVDGQADVIDAAVLRLVPFKSVVVPLLD